MLTWRGSKEKKEAKIPLENADCKGETLNQTCDGDEGIQRGVATMENDAKWG